MSHHSNYALAHTLDQMKPQQLCNNVFFGPLNTLSQQEFLNENNIRFFISVSIPVERVIEYAANIHLDRFLMCCFDQSFDRTRLSDEVMCRLLEFNGKHSADLKALIHNASLSDECIARPLQSLFYRSVAEYTTNIFTADGVQKFEQFNDLITLFKLSQLGNVLIFSSNGNDENLLTLLISQILKCNPKVSVMDAFTYVKNLRPTVENLHEDRIYWCSGLIAYHERARSKELYWGPGSPSSVRKEVPSSATKRREKFEESVPPDSADSSASTPFSDGDVYYSSDVQTSEPESIAAGSGSSRQFAVPRLKRMALNR